MTRKIGCIQFLWTKREKKILIFIFALSRPFNNTTFLKDTIAMLRYNKFLIKKLLITWTRVYVYMPLFIKNTNVEWYALLYKINKTLLLTNTRHTFTGAYRETLEGDTGRNKWEKKTFVILSWKKKFWPKKLSISEIDLFPHHFAPRMSIARQEYFKLYEWKIFKMQMAGNLILKYLSPGFLSPFTLSTSEKQGGH